MQKVLVAIAVIASLTLALIALQVNESHAAEWRAKQTAQPVVLGHRINSLGQEVLVIK